MGNSPQHIEAVQLILEKIVHYKNIKISKQDISDLLIESKGYGPTYAVSSVIRELVRHGVLVRKKEKTRYGYLIDSSKIQDTTKKINSMRRLSLNQKQIHEKTLPFTVLSRKEINDLFPMYSVIDIDRIIMKLQESGLIKKLYGGKTRGKYMVMKNSGQGEFISDPIVGAVSILGGNIIFCYNTALELHGLSRYGMSFVLYIHGSHTQEPHSIGDVAIRRVKIRSPDKGIMSLKRINTSINLTDSERTVIDCVHRPKYSIGWENVFYALRKIEHLDDNKVLGYLKAMRIPSLFAKMGVILEHFQDQWGISPDILNRMALFCPSTPVRFFWDEPGKLNKRWNIYVPEGLFVQS